MKLQKIVIALASLCLLASCGAGESSSEASSINVSSSEVKKTMDFIKDGQYYIDVPNDVVTTVDVNNPPYLKINDLAVQGSRADDLGGKFALLAEGAFANDLYVTIAKTDSQGHIAAKAYGAIEKERLNDAFEIINSYVGVPNKVFIAFSTTKASWPKGLDAEMDEEITFAWGLIG